MVLLITRHLLVVLGAAALMAGTIVGFVLARTVGIFAAPDAPRLTHVTRRKRPVLVPAGG